MFLGDAVLLHLQQTLVGSARTGAKLHQLPVGFVQQAGVTEQLFLQRRVEALQATVSFPLRLQRGDRAEVSLQRDGVLHHALAP